MCLVDPLFLYKCECLNILEILSRLNGGFEKILEERRERE